MRVRIREADHDGALTVTVCVNVRTEQIVPCCGARGGIEIAAALEREVAARGLPVAVQTIRCLGLCAKGPNARLAPSNSWFHEIAVADVPALADVLAAEAVKAGRSTNVANAANAADAADAAGTAPSASSPKEEKP